MKSVIHLTIFLTIILMMSYNNLYAQRLSAKQQSIVSISALTATGNLPVLTTSLNEGLDAGLTVNEIKEILVQLYAYCGFPRSLNAINTFITVTSSRKEKGIKDVIGIEPVALPITVDKYAAGKENLERLTGRTETGKTGYAEFVPVIDTFLKEHLFADIFSRGVLTDQERELTTVSALASLGGLDAQLQGHLSICINVGLTKLQLEEMLNMVEEKIGKKQADAGREVLKKVIAAKNQAH